MNARRMLALGLVVSFLAVPTIGMAAEDPAEKEGAPAATLRAKKKDIEYAVGLRGRYLFLPAGIIEMFVDHATAVKSGGFALELIRRKDDFELAVGLVYDSMEAESGLYLEKDDNPAVPGQYPDYVTFDGLGLVGADVTWTWGKRLHDRLELRYGAGIGLAIVTGGVYQADTQCPAGTRIGDLDDPGRCQKVGIAEKSDDVPPVFPIINAVIGLRARVNDRISVDLEGGLHNTLFVGAKAGYAF